MSLIGCMLSTLHVQEIKRSISSQQSISQSCKSRRKNAARLFGNPADISFSRMLEIDDANPLKGAGLLFYTKDMPVMCLGNISTSSGVVNGMCGTARHIVPNPAGK